MKILIVEDEPGPREGLFRLLQQASASWDVLPPCTNGADGLACIEALAPDLVITDIRMPETDGLEMIAALRQAGGGASIVVLSGYADFEYARRCLSLGVREYLVKPVTAEVILKSVRDVEDGHTVDRDMADWLQGRRDSMGTGILILFRLSEPLTLERRRVLRREIQPWLGSEGALLWVELPSSHECLFWVRGAHDLPKAGLPRFLSTLSQRLHAPVVGAALAVAGGRGDVAVAELRRSLKRFLQGPDLGFLWETDPGDEKEVPYPLALEKQARAALQARAVGALGAVFERLRAEVFRPGFDALSGLAVVRRFLFSLQNQLKDVDPARFAALEAWNPSARLDAVLDAVQLRRFFEQTASVLSAEATGASPETENLKVQAALALVAGKLTNPPSLAECAEQLGVSAEYLSRLFKAHMDMGYSRYVMSKRIERAKSLLADSSSTVLQISESLGFGNAKYFGAVFRKETGFTPSEYRERF